MGKHGPLPGARNAGRYGGRQPALQLTDEQLKTLEQYSMVPTSTLAGLARMLGIKLNYADEHLGRAIKNKYNKEPGQWLAEQHEQGVEQFGIMFFKACLSEKSNPILKIFAAKNWLGLKDERTIKQPDANNNSAIKALEAFNTILKSLNTSNQSKQIPAITPAIESSTTKSEYADYTPINTCINNDTPQQPDSKQHSNIVPIDSIVTNNQNSADTQDQGDSTVQHLSPID